MRIVENINNVLQRIDNACQRVGKNSDEITLIAVTKTVSVDAIKNAINNGIQHIGENRVQEAENKFDQIGDIAVWHLIGHLQTNKVKKALRFFNFIQSVDSLHLAEEISRQAVKLQRDISCLIEVKTAEEEDTKFGLHPEETVEIIKRISCLPNIKIEGLMTIGAFLPDPEEVRPCFRILRELRDEIIKSGIERIEMKYLSMGMTNDFEVAIEEGANMVRVGRAIFGER